MYPDDNRLLKWYEKDVLNLISLGKKSILFSLSLSLSLSLNVLP